MKKLMLSVAALAMLAACGQSTEQAQAPAIELYAMDCGHTAFTDTDMFADDGSFAGQARELIVPCYLIRHPSGDLIWDTGLPEAIADMPNGFTAPGFPARMSVPVKLTAQLAQLNLTPADVEYVSFSHMHSDHTGNGNLFIVAERGAAFRSTDGGSYWERIQLPYEGSMFGVIGSGGDHILCFGLRGNVYESSDLGSTWSKRDTGTELSLMGGALGADGAAVLVGGTGVVLSRGGDNDAFLATTHPDGVVLSSVLVIGPGEYTVVGEAGVSFYQP